ncbi:hypothetical protein CSC62_08610 [Pseudoxanthomonas jiangsuensis]|uniref:TonB-dependent receptor n=1 Tax=Pseudoxanthomonas jiangsuensis TaxID=619688 RepID=UPI001391CAB3|nr:TonB-dependent receptor [Pseudoxanthomonas jiangsuensis]KAF1697254.1 hypothetical protein CSC62_08610 [Pseudoxanthomonas jiangsuensis]
MSQCSHPLVRGILVSSILLALSSVANAQEGPEQKEVSATNLDQIVVTAQRREERIQDVPIAITAVSAETLAKMGVTSTNDLAMAVPGLDLGRQNGAIAPFIRGIGNKSTAPGEESAVPLYIDGVYVPTLTAGLFELAGVERIEVLKGPQGTLFGRNATSGVIQIVTRDPTEEFTAEARLGYGNYDTVEGGLYLAGAISPSVRADFSIFARDQGEGWGKNINTGNDVHKGSDLSVRSKWIVDVSPDTEVRFTVDYSDVEPNTAPAFRPYEDRILTSGPPLFAGSTPFYGYYDVSLSNDVNIKSEQTGANIQVRHAFDAFKFVSITSYRDATTRMLFDQDGGPAQVVSALAHEYAESWSQEFQLLSPEDARFNWILGGYYFNNKAGYGPISLYGSGLPFRVDRYSEMGAESYAIFGQASFNLTDATQLTTGLRYTQDTRDIEGRDYRNGVLAPATVGAQEKDFSKATWRLSLDHRFTPNIMGFAAASRGFKSGVYSAVSYLDAPALPETLDTYEIGLKSEFPDRHLRFNASVFYNDFKDVQVQSQVLGGIRLNNAASARTYGLDLEALLVPVDYLTIRMAATFLKGEYGRYPGASFYLRDDHQTLGAYVGDASGRDTIHTPDVAVSLGADYVIPMSVGDLTLAASYAYNDGYFFDPQNETPQASFSLFNASVAFQPADSAWSVRLWGKNLGDEKYLTSLSQQAYGDTLVPAAPRTYGISVEWKLN